MVSDILDAYVEELCPYCKTPLLNYVDKKGVKKNSCENHDTPIIIDTHDYMSVIINVIKYSDGSNEPRKFKNIMEF